MDGPDGNSENGKYRLTEFGIVAIEQAKKDGIWDATKGEPITDEKM